ncbi:amidoligase [Arthrobacter phage Salgado]|uniref:Amidoligase n=3 Tax=Laroyevirus TaxID=1982086 RepID=A0A0U4IXQ9_9CAUD|nr:amidoligase enzyme [Arthrobacter phage Laroye]YP_010082608.1 amidoligase enzyme [Arthrobacter phage LiSara]YP_010082707.1 amidoligase enzyme [Arthrobacter phage Salgado]ALY09622.1 amidoligase [Arthrobacter phage Laroye]ALY10263.1 amidoligase [Arthrobacter phage Salgado]ASR83678.1 amidoligase [Arthrobacter phage LiSara]
MTTTASTVTGQTTTARGYTVNVLDMRRPAVQARQDLSWELRQQGYSNADIMAMVGFNDVSSVSTAIKKGKARALLNAGQVSYRRFGVEVEFTGCTRQQVLDQLRELDPEFPVEIQGYNHRTTSVWKLITDASVTYGPEGHGLEAVSPILKGEEGFKQLSTLLKAIRQAGGNVDKSCGIHVHHDANDMTPMQVSNMVTLYTKNQRIMDQLVSRSRRAGENRYCEALPLHEATEAAERLKLRESVSHFNRFRTINVTSYPKYGTLEIRQHQGTLNARKVSSWVKVGQAMMAVAVKLAETEASVPVFQTVPEFMDYLTREGKLDHEVAEYMVERAEDLNG